ncbi:MAG: ABC transporter ATP-binding protein [Acidimicrobiales bacterium]
MRSPRPSRTRPAPVSRQANGIEARALSKSLRGRAVLTDLDLVVPRGTVAVVEGANGAGKTTLVRILSTVVTPDRGTAHVNGYDVVGRSLDVRRSIGVSFANERSLYWRINGFENLELFGRIAGLSRRAIAERSSSLLEELHLAEVARGQVARMSTGQRQRLMVARALLTNPAVILLDEPFRGLDEDGVRAMNGLVARLTADGLTALIVAPVIEEVLPIADAAYRIGDGRLEPTGPGRRAQPIAVRP